MSAMTMPVMASRPSVQLPARSARCAARVALRGNAVALRLAAPRARKLASATVAVADIDTEALKAKATAAAESALEAAKAQPVVAAYGAGLLVGLFFVEKLIHLPILDLVIAFPVELLGVMTAGVLALRYTKEGVAVEDDIAVIKAKLYSELPGLK